MTTDYRKFYYLERYLFCEVGPRFAKTGNLCPFDFYMILIWKANRAKTRIRDRLSTEKGGFAAAVKRIAETLHACDTPMRRLEFLMEEGFRLPMATAVLTVLYPNIFTVYDFRVCEQLGNFKNLASHKFSDRLWCDYKRFVNAVNDAVPGELSLRDKDRYLWARSFHAGVMEDLKDQHITIANTE